VKVKKSILVVNSEPVAFVGDEGWKAFVSGHSLVCTPTSWLRQVGAITKSVGKRPFADTRVPPRYLLGSPRLGLRATGPGMTYCPLSFMIWGVLSPWSADASDR